MARLAATVSITVRVLYSNLHIESRAWKPMHHEFMAAIKELGYEQLDLNAPQRSGTIVHLKRTDT